MKKTGLRNKTALRLFLAILLMLIAMPGFSQKRAFQLYNGKGGKVSYEKMVKVASEADIVLFGELHNNPISHWLQIELTRDLYRERGNDLILGAEMFEADNQLILDEYLQGFITEEKFESEARLWKNYTTDYKPLVEFAREHRLKFIATNIPRRYANSVFKNGLGILDSLSDDAKRYMAPLPLSYDTTLNCYAQLKQGGLQMSGHSSVNLVDAQAIKDATMSHFILENWSEGKLFVHFEGAYHSDFHESIYYWLKRSDPSLKIITISTVLQDDIKELENESEGRADFIIVVPSNMTPTGS